MARKNEQENEELDSIDVVEDQSKSLLDSNIEFLNHEIDDCKVIVSPLLQKASTAL